MLSSLPQQEMLVVGRELFATVAHLLVLSSAHVLPMKSLRSGSRLPQPGTVCRYITDSRPIGVKDGTHVLPMKSLRSGSRLSS